MPWTLSLTMSFSIAYSDCGRFRVENDKKIFLWVTILKKDAFNLQKFLHVFYTWKIELFKNHLVLKKWLTEKGLTIRDIMDTIPFKIGYISTSMCARTTISLTSIFHILNDQCVCSVFDNWDRFLVQEPCSRYFYLTITCIKLKLVVVLTGSTTSFRLCSNLVTILLRY